MPELPEVETIRRQLERTVKGKKIVRVNVRYPKVVRPLTAAAFARGVTDATIRRVARRAKLILLELSNGNTMVVHLKMTGRLLLKHDPEPPNPSTEIVFDLSGPTKLYYDDQRRFGFITIMATEDLKHYLEVKAAYGPEPLAASFTIKKFAALLKTKPRLKIKPLLMDQKFLAGVGNIYAQEACFYSRVLPTRTAGSLTAAETRMLYDGLRQVMHEAIRYGGSSADNYLDVYGKQGRFVPHLKVYGRAGQPCPRCKNKLVKKFIGSRGTVFCPGCQQ